MVKTTMRYHSEPIRMAITNKSTNNNCWQGCGERKPLYTVVGMQTGAATMKKQYEGSSEY